VCVVILCIFVVLCGHCFFLTLDTGLLARSQYSGCPETGHFDTGFSWFEEEEDDENCDILIHITYI